MNDIHERLVSLGGQARDEPPPVVDVRLQVMKTLEVEVASHETPLAIALAAMAVAASVVVASLSTLQTMVDPWACYMSP